MVNQFEYRQNKMREWIYGKGCPKGNEELFLEKYRTHNKEVKEYFKYRKEDLLIMSLEEGDGWEELCPFLGQPIPDKPFPHANKGEYVWYKKKLKRLKLYVYRLIRKLPFVEGTETGR